MTQPAPDLFAHIESRYGYHASQPYPPDGVGHRGDPSSVSAAQKTAPTAAQWRERVFRAIQRSEPAGLTNSEIRDLLGCKARQSQPRTSDLQKMGRIEKRGQRVNADGNPEAIWRVKG